MVNQKLKSDFLKSIGISTLILNKENLVKHMIKSNHANCLQYVDKIPEIISTPDYIGRNKNINGKSLEVIKIYLDNLLLAIKYDSKRDYYYIASLYDVTQSKLDHMINNNRVRKLTK
ncbi:hypothetical protein KG089_03670 [Carnobacteriaceae bacterium zg-ZUI252]|nr:hypothetical protein [Carnobacteriaceae bacterium zg-ZUI252]MBS4769578.1 hypothetical protein [Carnobacteriaceae bacterium zg-ZUI240]QTU83043.1 hypothetical protein J7S27_00520 [Carnobacteriaceae bacterium zg-C25]